MSMNLKIKRNMSMYGYVIMFFNLTFTIKAYLKQRTSSKLYTFKNYYFAENNGKL